MWQTGGRATQSTCHGSQYDERLPVELEPIRKKKIVFDITMFLAWRDELNLCIYSYYSVCVSLARLDHRNK